jgi:hypothetical protein
MLQTSSATRTLRVGIAISVNDPDTSVSRPADFLGEKTYVLADGSKVPIRAGTTYILPSILIGTDDSAEPGTIGVVGTNTSGLSRLSGHGKKLVENM